MEIESSVPLNQEMIEIGRLAFDPANAKRHPKKNLDAIKGMLMKYGQRTPIVVDEKNIVLKGNGTLACMKELGFRRAWIVRWEDLDEVQKAGYAIGDNRSSELGEWDDGVLAKQLLALRDLDFDLPAIGWDDDDLKSLFKDIPDEVNPNFDEQKEDELPSEVPSRVIRGDIWKLGEHRIMCGNSTDGSDVSRLMAGRLADMVFTDPPYNTGMSAKTNGDSTWLSHMFNDDFTDEEWHALLSGFTAQMHKSMKDGSVAYVCLDWRRNHELVMYLDKFFKRSNMIVWDKMVHGLGSDYKYTHELINVCKKGPVKLYTNHGEQDYQDIWHIQRKIGRDEDHATKKPIEIIERALSHASLPSDIVLDLFLGSGSTLIACEKVNRACYGMELDPKYCDIILQRWENATGGKAELVEREEPSVAS